MAVFGIAVFFAILFGSLTINSAMATPPAKVDICHADPDNDGAGLETISVSERAVQKHLAHGDHTGACFVCGDNFTDPPTEECDDGGSNSDVIPNACRTTCQLPFCGDGVADTHEECDGSDLRRLNCTDFGFEQGQLSCASCSFDTSSCFEE